VTLAESQGKKAAFLQEAVRVLGLSTKVHSQRAELLRTQFDCVTLRAVDRMHEAISAASKLVAEGGWLAPMTTTSEFAGVKLAAGTDFTWSTPVVLPGGDDRIVPLGVRKISSPA
jgi:16S rRNA (guanine527-N7)-methyltransferase